MVWYYQAVNTKNAEMVYSSNIRSKNVWEFTRKVQNTSCVINSLKSYSSNKGSPMTSHNPRTVGERETSRALEAPNISRLLPLFLSHKEQNPLKSLGKDRRPRMGRTAAIQP